MVASPVPLASPVSFGFPQFLLVPLIPLGSPGSFEVSGASPGSFGVSEL